MWRTWHDKNLIPLLVKRGRQFVVVDEYLVKEHIMDHLQDEMEFMVNTGDSDKESSICSESDDDYSDVWESRSCIIND
jgi:hypothetical protein